MSSLSSFVVILAAVVAAPILSELFKRWIIVPTVVLEILLGVLIGPVLEWAHTDTVIDFLAEMGLATLMFLAGLEIDLPRVAGRPLRRAAGGFGISLALGVAIGAALTEADGARSGLIVGLALTTTALGTLLPILRDSGEIRTDFGTDVLAGAAVGELGPIVAISLLLTTDRPARTVLVMVGFVVLIVGLAFIATRSRAARVSRLIENTLTTSGQFVVRLVVLFLASMVWLAAEFGLDILLGAMAAGILFRMFSAGASEREAELVEAKLQGLGFGFLVPLFFVISGMRFDLDSITSDPILLLVAAGFAALFVVVHAVPVAVLHRESGRTDRVALTLFLATCLPLVVVITDIGVRTQRLNSGKAAALVAAAMLSVLVYPLLAGRLREGQRSRPMPPEPRTQRDRLA